MNNKKRQITRRKKTARRLGKDRERNMSQESKSYGRSTKRRITSPWSEISLGKNAKVLVKPLDDDIMVRMPDINATFEDRGIIDLILERVRVRK